MATVSIVIPVFNGAKHIGAAIESVLAQQDVDLELIVADNASTDETAAIVGAYADPRIRLVTSPTNIGAPRNFDRAIGLAGGTYVKLLPADDLIEPGSLAKQIAVLNADRAEEIALVFGARKIIDDNGRLIARRGLGKSHAGRIGAAWLVRQCVRKGTNMIGEPGTVLLRKALADRIGGFDPSLPYVIDLDYWTRLLAHGDAYYCADPVSSFRISTGSWSAQIGDRQSGEMIAFIDLLRTRGAVHLSGMDVARGKAMAKLNNMLRLIFYKFIAKKG